MSDSPQLPTEQLVLVNEVRQLIDSAKQRAAVTVNAEISLLYWQVGKRIHQEVLKGERAEYGKQVIAGLSQQLKQAYGKGWSEQQLRHCLYAAETFTDEKIFYTLCRELSWSHFYSSHGLRGNSSKNALRSVTQSVTGCIPTLERGNDDLIMPKLCTHCVHN